MPPPPPPNKMDLASRDALLDAYGIEPRLKLREAAAVTKAVTGADRTYSVSTMSRTLVAHDITGLKKVRLIEQGVVRGMQATASSTTTHNRCATCPTSVTRP
jgi:hypothetical protein